MQKWIVSIAIIVMSVSLWSAPVWAQHHGGRGAGGLGRLLRGLDLTSEQKEQVRAIRTAHQQVLRDLGQQLREARENLATRLLTPGNVSAQDLTPQAQRITQLHEQAFQEKLQLLLEIRQLLTPEQLAKAGQIRSRMRSLHEEMRGLMPGSYDEEGDDAAPRRHR